MTLEQIGTEYVRGVKSQVYQAKNENGKILFTHSTARQHVAFLARNVLKMLAGDEPESMSATYHRH